MPKTGSYLVLPLFIEGNHRVSEDRRRACSESVERKVVRVRFGLNTAKPGGSSLIVNLYISFLYKILYLWHKLRMERWQRKI